MQTLVEPKNDSIRNHKLSLIYSFFCWCSGARLYILKQCPSDFNKYYGIGVIVFLTGIMASLSGGYAIFTVFRSIWISLVFGLLWGFLIFSIDWYIVSSLRKHQNKLKELAMAFPRFVLAILIAIVVSMPLKLKLFEREIEQQILFDQQQSVIDYQKLVSTEFNDIERLENENIILRDEISKKETQRNTLFSMIVDEAEGLSPTRAIGKGPVYREKKSEYDKVDSELASLRVQNNKIIDENNIYLQQLRDRREQVISEAQVTNRESDGFLARLEAMDSLTMGNQSIKLASLFIIFLFITIESAPIIVKLLSERGPYDDMIEAEEYIKQVEIRKLVVQAELTEDHQIDLHRLLEKERNEKLYDVEKNHIENEAIVLSEINKRKIHKWKEEEIAKLNNSDLSNGNSLLANDREYKGDGASDSDQTKNIFEPELSPELKDIPIYADDNINTLDDEDISSIDSSIMGDSANRNERENS
jgi:hypothetical protein